MRKFSAEEEIEVWNSISEALTKAEKEGQPVRQLAEAAAQGRQLKCVWVSCGDGRVQLVLSLEDE